MGRPPICLSRFLAADLRSSKETLPKFTVFNWSVWPVILTSGLPLSNGYLSSCGSGSLTVVGGGGMRRGISSLCL